MGSVSVGIRALMGALCVVFSTAGWAVDASAVPPTATPDGPALMLPLEPIHNAFRLGSKVLCGSSPVGDDGFRALQAHGVKTIVSVDGARPDGERATRFGLRYVHIPVAYGGITRGQALTLARAIQDLPGPVFIHCHHGQHRGPAAAVIAVMAQDGWTNEQALAAMTQAGTSPHYIGLWKSVRTWTPITAEELASVGTTFPAAVTVAATVASMLTIDERWDHLRAVREAGWKAPAAHPDIDPAHEALLLREDFRELARLPATGTFPGEYRQRLSQAETAAAALMTAIRAKDAAAAQQAFQQVGASCTSCHADFRDPDLQPSHRK